MSSPLGRTKNIGEVVDLNAQDMEDYAKNDTKYKVSLLSGGSYTKEILTKARDEILQ